MNLRGLTVVILCAGCTSAASSAIHPTSLTRFLQVSARADANSICDGDTTVDTVVDSTLAGDEIRVSAWAGAGYNANCPRLFPCDFRNGCYSCRLACARGAAVNAVSSCEFDSNSIVATSDAYSREFSGASYGFQFAEYFGSEATANLTAGFDVESRQPYTLELSTDGMFPTGTVTTKLFCEGAPMDSLSACSWHGPCPSRHQGFLDPGHYELRVFYRVRSDPFYEYNEFYRFVSYTARLLTGTATAVVPASWSGVKGLYR